MRKLSQSEISDIIYQIDKTEIYKYGVECEGIFFSYWMFVRFSLFLDLRRFLYNFVSYPKIIEINFFEKLQFFFSSYRYRPRTRKSDVLFLSPGIGNIDYGDYSVNIYHDLFAEEIKNAGMSAAILEMPFKKIFKPRHNCVVDCLNWEYLKLKIKDKIYFGRTRFSEVEVFLSIIINILSAYLESDQIDSVISNLKNILFAAQKDLKRKIFLWRKIFNIYSPKYVVCQDVSYGQGLGIMSLVLKKLGVVIIEDQHGCIGQDHVSYNHYGCSKYLNFLPDYFWVYGKKWLSVINLPAKKRVIGNPFLIETCKYRSDETICYDVLVVTDSEYPEFTLKTVRGLLDDFNITILFRPHPRELQDAEKRYSDVLKNQRVKLDCQRSVYASIQSVGLVIVFGSYFSTVGFEALAMNKRVVMIVDSDCSVIGLELVRDMVYVLTDHNFLKDIFNLKTKIKNDLSGFYAGNWRENITNFFNEV